MLTRHKDDLDGLFEDVFLHGYPNPDRVGCPGNEVLRSLAAHELPIDHPACAHVAHCSPCFKEFRTFERQAAAVRRRRLIVATAVAACLIIFATVAIRVLIQPKTGSEIASVALLRRTADLFEQPDAFRGEQTSHAKPVYLPPAPLELKVILPRFSRPGTYQIALCSDRHAASTLVKAVARAVADGPREVVTVMLDLRGIKPGSYWLSTRNADNDASDYFPAKVAPGA